MKLTRTFPLLAVAGAVGLAACGGSGGSGGGTATAAGGSSGAGAHTVSVQSIKGSRVLVDSRGRALYSPVQEAGGRIMCTGSCTSIWMPAAAKGTPTGGSGVGKLGVVHRPGGGTQVTVNGKPAYTFVQDQPGQVTGQNVKDAFGGRHFTWHTLTATGASPPAPSSGGSGGSTGGIAGD